MKKAKIILHDHQADGIATRGEETELVEIELTPKAIERYAPICNSHSWRMTREGITRVVYLCTADATRMVKVSLEGMEADISARGIVRPTKDGKGAITIRPSGACQHSRRKCVTCGRITKSCTKKPE